MVNSATEPAGPSGKTGSGERGTVESHSHNRRRILRVDAHADDLAWSARQVEWIVVLKLHILQIPRRRVSHVATRRLFSCWIIVIQLIERSVPANWQRHCDERRRESVSGVSGRCSPTDFFWYPLWTHEDRKSTRLN